MERYAAGDEAAFEELFRRYEGRAYAFFVRRTSSAERAKDLYQELFLRIHRGRDAYDPTRPFTPWFFQIAHRILIDEFRRAHRSHEVALDGSEPRAEQPRSDDRLADREQLTEALDVLSPVERYVLVSSKVEGIGYPQLAVELGKSIDAVKKMASRAMQRVRATPRPGMVPIALRSR